MGPLLGSFRDFGAAGPILPGCGVYGSVGSCAVPSAPKAFPSLLRVSPLFLAHGFIPSLGSITSAICACEPLPRSMLFPRLWGRKDRYGAASWVPKLTAFKAIGYKGCGELNIPSIWPEKRRRKAAWVPVCECSSPLLCPSTVQNRTSRNRAESFGTRAQMKDLGLLYRSVPSVPRETIK